MCSSFVWQTFTNNLSTGVAGEGERGWKARDGGLLAGLRFRPAGYKLLKNILIMASAQLFSRVSRRSNKQNQNRLIAPRSVETVGTGDS